jgi:hypothetical protein
VYNIDLKMDTKGGKEHGEAKDVQQSAGVQADGVFHPAMRTRGGYRPKNSAKVLEHDGRRVHAVYGVMLQKDKDYGSIQGRSYRVAV